MDDASASWSPTTEFDREYAIKLLSKADLDEDELVAQLTEVRSVPSLRLPQQLTKNDFHATTDQSIPAHPGIVTLYRSWKLRRSSFTFSNLFPVKICSTSWSWPTSITTPILPLIRHSTGLLPPLAFSRHPTHLSCSFPPVSGCSLPCSPKCALRHVCLLS